MNQLLTVAEVAAQLHEKPHTVMARLRSGALRGSKPGKRWLIDPDDLAEYVETHANRPKPRRRRQRAA